MPSIIGIDEAGRGPIIGALVMCGVCADAKAVARIKRIGAKDSKMLTPKQREEMYEKLVKLPHRLAILEPAQIDAAIVSANSNLNWLEAEHAAQIVNSFDAEKAYIDCPSPNLLDYKQFLMRKMTKNVELVVEHKAERYPVVAAASIIAKVTRDTMIEELKKKIGIDFGSGYLSDPLTVKFLNEHYLNHALLFRKQWGPYKDLMVKKVQMTLGNF
ncbi:MAG TPA: ribonuclease HII [Candidatus Nanoarchaeia archaeon]|nr:ribonuclease HII [Candidatus Nanoarchaeia archaeon]